MATKFFDVDREMRYYKTDTPNHLITGMSQFKLPKKRYHTRYHVPESQILRPDETYTKHSKKP